VTAPAPKPHQLPFVADLAAKRERREMRADYERNLSIIKAAVAVPEDVLDRIAALERVVADQARTIEAQDVRIAVFEGKSAGDEDGTARPPGRWRRLKEASRRTGYSISGLKRLCRLGHVRFDYEGPHRLIDIDTVPSKLPKVPKVSP
jgi:hypothetical protein